MVVNLRAGRAIVVDARVPLSAASEATGAATRAAPGAMARHARQVRTTWERSRPRVLGIGTPRLVVMLAFRA
jgi:hypothetical protein